MYLGSRGRHQKKKLSICIRGKDNVVTSYDVRDVIRTQMKDTSGSTASYYIDFQC